MPYDYEANITAVYNALANANTTTATVDLSSGLTRRVQNISKADPENTSIREDSYPNVWVRLATKDEEYGSLGNTGPTGNKKFATVIFDIFGLYKRDGTYTQDTTILTEVYRLAENIEGVFQKELTLSGTALWCNPKRTEFFGPMISGSTAIKGVLVELEARYLFR